MNIKTIFLQKSRTINTEGTLGRDSYRKITLGMEGEREEEETVEEARKKLSKEVDEGLNKEVEKLKANQKKYSNF